MRPSIDALISSQYLIVRGHPYNYLCSAGPYAVKESELKIYRLPYLTSGTAGFAAHATAKALERGLPPMLERATAGLRAAGVQVTVLWGTGDRWLTGAAVERGIAVFRDAVGATCTVRRVEGAGHFAQSDYAEKVSEALLPVVLE